MNPTSLSRATAVPVHHVLHAPLLLRGQGRISPITLADHPRYQQFFAQDQRHACYGNSLIYLTQACRGFGLGLKYDDGDTLLSIGCHRDHYVIVRPLGVIDRRLLDLLTLMREISGKPVFLKKLFPDQAQQLRQMGPFSDAAQETYPWDADAFADDDTYPEIILDLDPTPANASPITREDERPIAEQGEYMSHFTWNRSRRTQRKYLTSVRRFQQMEVPCTLRPYTPALATDVRAFLRGYFAAQPQNVAAYEAMLTLGDLHTNRDRVFSYVASLDERDEVVGLLVTERLDADTAGDYAGIVSRQYPGLSELGLTQLPACAPFQPAGSQPRPRWGRSETGGWQDG